jgi:DNA/RNA endonuclease YhcR with UshA esterase domain
MEQEKITTPTPQERYHQETHCQSCGRFVGVYTRCPYCQALTQKRLSIRVFKVISVLTSTVGLLMLLFYARHVQTPEVKISDLGPLSNFAHVRIVGEVETSYGVHPKWGSLGFVIAQGDDEKRQTIRVSAYSKVAREIQAGKLVPQKGDIVSVEGQVRFQKDAASLLINAHEHLTFIRRENSSESNEMQATPVEADKVDQTMVDKLVSITGSVLTTREFAGKGLIVNLDNGKEGFPVWVPSFVLDGDPRLHPGDLVEAVGTVETFRDKLEVKVSKKGNFKIISRVNTAAEATEGD